MRRQRALTSPFLRRSREAYRTGFQRDLDHYYSGLNAFALVSVEADLARGEPAAWAGLFASDEEAERELRRLDEERQRLAAVVGFSLAGARGRGEDPSWIVVSEADYALLTSGRAGRVAQRYREALAKATPFDLEAVERQLLLYRDLGLLGENVEAALGATAEARTRLPPAPEPPGRVLLFTGHRIDAPGRYKPRLPASAEERAREMIRRTVAAELAGARGPTVGLAGGASGGDTLFREVWAELGVPTTVFLAGPRDPFVAASVADAGGSWVARFDRLLGTRPVRVLGDRLDLPSWLVARSDYSVWQRNNLWILHNALAFGAARVALIALWNGEAGDGPGGTDDMVQRARQRGARVLILEAKELLAHLGAAH